MGVPVTNRGLHYGDGVFETMLCENGAIRYLDAHLERARLGCERLGMRPPAQETLLDDVKCFADVAGRVIVKLLLVRSGTSRGYRPAPDSGASRLWLLYPWSDAPRTLRLQWCTTRWTRNPLLAGLKHLNRLEQVLAQAELAADVDEGIMLDTAGELVSATSGNLFIVRSGTLRTPALQQCGVRGVFRTQVIAAAHALGIPVEEAVLWPADLESADEAFVTNAIRGIRPIVRLGERAFPVGAVTERLQRALAQ
jgi:4-amino-4-deoxychorismate lyase